MKRRNLSILEMTTGKKQVMWTLGAVILSVLGSVIGNGPGMAPGMCAKDKVYHKSTIFYVNGNCGTTRKTCPSDGTLSVSKCYYRTKYRRCVKPRTKIRTFISTTYVCCPGYTVSSTGKCVPEKCDWSMFGENCDQSCPCNEPYYLNCHRQSGLCNCSSGRTGLDCSKEDNITDLSTLTFVSNYIHLGGIIGAVVVLAAVVALFSILTRRSMCPLFRNTDEQQGQVYEEIVRHNNRYEEPAYCVIHIYHQCDNRSLTCQNDMAAAEGHGDGISAGDDNRMRENSYTEVLPEEKITSDSSDLRMIGA